MLTDEKQLKGNKGEWSEIYVFLKLLADGKLYAADENLDIIQNIFYPIIKILREEANLKCEFSIADTIKIIDSDKNTELGSCSIKDFVDKSKELFEKLKQSTGRSMSFPEIEEFLKSIHIDSLSDSKNKKSDIKIVVHDTYTGLKPTLGFSIKSMLGKNSTLFNPGAGTNFIFKILNPAGISFDLARFNKETLDNPTGDKRAKIARRISSLEELGLKLLFDKIQSDTLQLSLQVMDSRLPEILAHLVYIKYKSGTSRLTELLDRIDEENPLNFDMSKGHQFYKYKIKTFLTDAALGMTPETVWNGTYDATGGIIIVKQTGDLVCYHIYNKNEFQDYLMNNTRLEEPATSEDKDNPGHPKQGKDCKPFKFGWVYEENGELFMKLNLQIRFA